MLNKISIIIPNFNQGVYAKECFQSIIKSDLPPDEVIIIDDCSTDNSLDLIKNNLEIVMPENLSIVWKVIEHKENKKLPATRNTGIKGSKGDYIVCLDMDDMIPPNYLSSCLHTLRKHEADISYCDSMMFGYREGVTEFPEFNYLILRSKNFINCSAMFKRKVWESNQYDESFVDGFEDYEFWVSAYKNKYKFKKNNKSCLLYRQKPDSMLASLTVEKLGKNRARFNNKHKGFIFW